MWRETRSLDVGFWTWCAESVTVTLSFHQQVKTHEDASVQKYQHQQFDLKVSSFSDLRAESQLNHL